MARHGVRAESRPTRGHGLLEPLLARMRARQANALIPHSLRDGRILDIGCGSSPYFLSHTYFREKFAIDQCKPSSPPRDIYWHTIDLNRESHLPFDDGYFSAVTLLAVAEHLDPSTLVGLFSEAYRTLRVGGLVVITTPTPWCNSLLRGLASIGLVSKEEIDEHVFSYTLPLLGWYFGKSGFSLDRVRFGYFELGFNLWATAEK